MDRRKFFGATAGVVITSVIKPEVPKTQVRTPETPTLIELRLMGKRGSIDKPTEVLHRWTISCRRVVHPRLPSGEFPARRMELYSEAGSVKLENQSSERLYVERLEGELLDIPGLLFDSPLGHGPFEELAWGTSVRKSYRNEAFWLDPHNNVTFDWGSSTPVATF